MIRIAQSCLYGVDKNPFAVNLARLSLWLVGLSKDAPFTFVDHALQCGDSLMGIDRAEIESALQEAFLQGAPIWTGSGSKRTKALRYSMAIAAMILATNKNANP